MSKILKLNSPFQLISQKNFFLVWSSGFLIGTIRWLDMLAVSLFVFDLTDSAFFVAVMMFLRMFPLLIFGAFAGSLAEIFDRKGILIFGLLVMTINYILLAFLTWKGVLELWHLMIGVFLGGVFWTFEMPIRRTIIAELAELDNIAVSMGLDTATNNFTRMIGPLTGGFLYEVSGLHGTMLLGGVLYFSVMIMLLFVKYRNVTSHKTGSILFDLGEGVKYIRSNQQIVGILIITIAFNIFGFSCVSMIPVIAKEVLHLSAFPIGILLSGEGVGAVFGSLLVAFLVRRERFNHIYFFGALLYIISIGIFALSQNFWMSLLMMSFGGFGIAGFSAMQSALILAHAPPQMRSRIMGILTMCIGSSPIGVILVGILVNYTTASTGVFIMAILGAILILLAAFFWPDLLKAEKHARHL